MALFLSLHAPAQEADLIVVGGSFAGQDAHVDAMAIKDQKILALGRADDVRKKHVGPSTRVLDTTGNFVAPGFIESHGHFAGLGQTLRTVDLVGAASEDEAIARVVAAAQKIAPGEWIAGRGWDQNLWAKKVFPDLEKLSAATPKHPVFLTRVDGHAAWANRAALELAKIDDKTPSPSGGEIIRDERTKAATGIFIDNAMDLFDNLLPRSGSDLIARDLLAAQAIAFENGITSFHDAGTSRETISIMDRLMESGALGIRLYVMIGSSGQRTAKEFLKVPPIIDRHDGRLTVRAVKLGIDGALGSRGAALLEDYADRPGYRGLSMLSPKELESIGEAALDAGYQVCVHAIGDAGNRAVLDAWDALAKRRPELKSARFRIEHAQIVDGADIPRFKKLGLIAAMQGVHATSDLPWVPERIGDERTIEGAYVWKKFLDQGTPVANGTDAPVENVSPFESFYASVTRMRKDGTPKGGWQPDQRMSRDEALASYTTSGAFAAFEEGKKGVLAEGMLADFVVLDRNILKVEPAEILTTRVLRTFVGGREVYRRPNGR